MSSWWYSLVGDATKRPWAVGEALPEGADWTRMDFLNQFLNQSNARRALAYATGLYRLDAPERPLLSDGHGIGRARNFRDFANACRAFWYYDGGHLPAEGETITGRFKNAYLEPMPKAIETGDALPGETLTWLKNLMEPKIVCGHWKTWTSNIELAGGTVSRKAWDWQYQLPPDISFWEEETAQPVLLNNFGASYADDSYAVSGFAHGYRAVQSIQNPVLEFAGTGIEATATLAIYCVGSYVDTQNGGTTDNMGWPWVGGVGRCRRLASQEASVNGSQLVTASGIFGPTELFRDYDPTPDTEFSRATFRFNFARFAELIDEWKD